MPELDRDEALRCAAYLKALGDPTRLRIVKSLQSGALTVSDIAELLEIDITSVSHHLRVLYHAAITTTQRDGKYIYYSLNPQWAGTKRRHEALNFGCCKIELGS